MFCAQCGQWLAEGDSACPRCGTPAHGAATGTLPGAPVAAGPPAPPEPTVRFAGFWRRFWTMIVDGVVLFFPIAVVRVLLGDDVFGTSAAWGSLESVRGQIAGVVIWWVYCAGLESSAAQGTLGQQLLGIRVCDDRLRRISFARATARSFAQWMSVFICGIGYLVNLFTKKRQTLHDLVAGCVLARADSLVAPAPAPGGTS